MARLAKLQEGELKTMANDLKVPWVKIVLSCREAYMKMMQANIQFESSIQKLLAN